MLPVISRSQLGITPTNPLPSWAALQRCPLHLLGAIYALALRFVSEDDYLAVWSSQTSPSSGVMWRLVYEQLQEEVHRPQLAVLQATLLYLHKEPGDEREYSLSDTPFVWSWVGKLVGLTMSLGVQTECSMWAIPAWEKRLRKRLWWAVYAEDKWRSLLMGRPPYIHSQEWDIEDLDVSHFALGSSNATGEGGAGFRSFIALTRIAESIQQSLYSLRASQRLSTDLTASVQTARPLLARLNVWRSTLADSVRLADGHHLSHGTGTQSSIHFAYYILVIYVYRALFRPMVPSNIPPHIIDLEEPIMDDPIDLPEFNWDAAAMANDVPFPALDSPSDSQMEVIEDITRAANECAAGMMNLVGHFSFRDLSRFWYSCKYICGTVLIDVTRCGQKTN